ncbi:hypothetical protein Y1Q_0008723 [Alligator mississippiensis]|uniref:Uncharacterized protein n=1 Tax=Alligator mississippiensis TaxID=8496 RepID=A0A151N9T6_ALLMI|nr:hypothetical protein Y1Q_0008723 [Alligator mississippiensis]
MYLASHPDKLELGPSLTEDSGPGEVELASRLLEEQRTQAAELIGEFGDVFQETPGEARVNAADKFDAYLMPRVDELVENIGQAHYISTLDLTKASATSEESEPTFLRHYSYNSEMCVPCR